MKTANKATKANGELEVNIAPQLKYLRFPQDSKLMGATCVLKKDSIAVGEMCVISSELIETTHSILVATTYAVKNA